MYSTFLGFLCENCSLRWVRSNLTVSCRLKWALNCFSFNIYSVFSGYREYRLTDGITEWSGKSGQEDFVGGLSRRKSTPSVHKKKLRCYPYLCFLLLLVSSSVFLLCSAFLYEAYIFAFYGFLWTSSCFLCFVYMAAAAPYCFNCRFVVWAVWLLLCLMFCHSRFFSRGLLHELAGAWFRIGRAEPRVRLIKALTV